MAYTINRKDCINCYQCLHRCPSGAIGAEGGVFRIHPERCTECGVCFRECHFGAVEDSNGKTNTPQNIPSHDPVVYDAELVVIGAGATGITAAVRTAWLTGKRVIVLESAKFPGGCGWFGGGVRTFGCRAGEKLGVVDVRPDQVEQSVQKTFWQLDSALIGKVIYALGPFTDWCCDMDPGLEDRFEVFQPFPHMKPETALKPNRGIRSCGQQFLEILLRKADELGIAILTQTRAYRIERDADGSVCAVHARDPGGHVTVRARTCILAAGNWIANREISREVVPSFQANWELPANPHMLPTCQGDGITLAESAGIPVDRSKLAARIFGPHIMPAVGGADFFGSRFEAILVNRLGQRWVNEKKHELDAGMLLLEQPDGCAYALMDAGILDRTYKNFCEGIGNEANGGPEVRPPKPEYRAILDAALEANPDLPHKKADTLAELAGLTGMPADALEETVRRYNEFCFQEIDKDYYKPAQYLIPFTGGPYYAFYGCAVSDGGFGGAEVNAEFRVVDGDGKPVPGLFAGGDNCCGWFIKLFGGKQAFINDLSWAFASGYLAAETISDDLRSR